MKKVICPNCGVSAYTSSPEVYSPCGHCGLVFNEDSSVGQNSRSEDRYCWSSYCQIFAGEGLLFVAKTLDISPNGAGIRHHGRQFVSGEIVRIKIDSIDMERPATVVWSKTEKDLFECGLRLSEPISLPFVHKKSLGSIKNDLRGTM